jgi:hypothetical protein
MGGIDHHLVRLAALGGQGREYPVEHVHPAPADEPAVDRLRRAVCRSRIAPAQTVTDHEDDVAYDPPVIHPRNPMRQRKVRLDPLYLPVRKLGQVIHQRLLHR